jgi:uncharacterized protein YfaS (alpha-2-macroglobulin family)
VTPRHLLIVSPFNLISKRSVDEVLVWVTDLQTGQPVAGVPVRMEGANEVQVVSDDDGIARGAVTTKEPWSPITIYAGSSPAMTGQLQGRLARSEAGQSRGLARSETGQSRGLARSAPPGCCAKTGQSNRVPTA